MIDGPIRIAALAAVVIILCGMMSLRWTARATTPLGVRVPTDRVHDAAVKRAQTGFVAGAVGSACVAALLVLVLPPTTLALVLPGLVCLIGGLSALTIARRHILLAKRRGDWFAGKPTRILAEVAETRPSISVQPGRYVLSYVLIAVTILVGAFAYDAIPESIPVHWNSLGEATDFAPKSLLTAFAGPLIALGITTLLLALASALRARGVRLRAEDGPHAAERAAAEQWSTQGLLSWCALLLTAGALTLSFITWFVPEDSAAVVVAVASAATMGSLLIAVVGYMVVGRRAVAATYEASAAESPDDDSNWIGGIFYLNREDPSVLVPKRVGIGWTANLANPLAVITLVLSGLLLLVVVAIAWWSLA